MRLSIIVPGYNTQVSLWQRCIKSLFCAMGPEDEIICVDDGSDFAITEDIFAESNLPGDGHLKILRKKNGGLASARNAALEIARGKFVTFVDSDDEVRYKVFERCIDKLEHTLSDVCIYGVEVIWVRERLVKIDCPDERVYGQLSPQDIKDLSSRCLFNYACNKVYRMDFLKGRHLHFENDGMPCEDVIFNLGCVIGGGRWCSIDYVGYIYYRFGTTILSRYNPSYVVGIRLASEMWKIYKEKYPEAKSVLGGFGEVSEYSINAAEKRNRLRPGSPYWYSILYNFLRSLFYVRCIRRCRIRHMFPNVVDWNGSV